MKCYYKKNKLIPFYKKTRQEGGKVNWRIVAEKYGLCVDNAKIDSQGKRNCRQRGRVSAAWSSVGSVVEWLKRRACDQHVPGSKPTRTILLCPWKRHFSALSLLGGLGKQF